MVRIEPDQPESNTDQPDQSDQSDYPKKVDPGECELCLSGFHSQIRYECQECGRFIGSCCWSISSNQCLECKELAR